MPNRTRSVVLVGIIALTAFLIVQLPARVLAPGLADAGIEVYGMQGTLWRGQADDLQISGISLGQVTWRFRAGQILLARLAYRLEIDGPMGIAQGNASVNPLGHTRLDTWRGTSALDRWPGVFGLAGADGTVSVALDLLNIHGAWPTDVVGQGEVRALVVRSVGMPPLDMGGYMLTVSARDIPPDAAITAEIRDQGQVLDLSGRMTLSPDRSWLFEANIKPRDDAPRALTDSLMLFGAPDAAGYRAVSLEGSL